MTQHIVMCAPKKLKFLDRYAPMSYGRGNEPSPELLLKRGRATIFNSIDEAKEALKSTLIQADKNGAKWTGEHVYEFIEVQP